MVLLLQNFLLHVENGSLCTNERGSDVAQQQHKDGDQKAAGNGRCHENRFQFQVSNQIAPVFEFVFNFFLFLVFI